MELLAKYTIPLFDSTDPAAAAPDPAAAPVVPDPAVATPPPDNQDAGKGSMVDQITSLRSQKRDLEAELERTKREAAEAKAIAERIQRGGDNKGVTTPPATERQISDADIQYILFRRDVEELKQKGINEYGEEFIAEVTNPEGPAHRARIADDRIVKEIIDIDRANAHKLLMEITRNYQTAKVLASMSPAQRVAEITRMSIAMADKTKGQQAAPTAPAAPVAPPKQASKAPAPPPVIDPGTTKTIDWRSDEASDEEFDRGFDEMVKTRMMRR